MAHDIVSLPTQGVVTQAVADYEAARAAEEMEDLAEMDALLDHVRHSQLPIING